jgi:hypothetical protein
VISDERTNYPTGTTPFTDIGLTFDGTAPTVDWGISDWDTSDALTGTVTANGATNAQVVIHYPVA